MPITTCEVPTQDADGREFLVILLTASLPRPLHPSIGTTRSFRAALVQQHTCFVAITWTIRYGH
jgi:hypothetical protein